MKKRLDQHIVDLGLAPSKTKAQELVESGQVEVLNGKEWRLVDKSSRAVAPEAEVRLLSQELLRFVSRAGLKLEGALQEAAVNVQGLKALDVGISTGGFTDCLLQYGARQVVGVDVGENELAESLRHDSRVKFYGGVNARHLREASQLRGDIFDLAVVDVSFISLEKILPEIYHFISSRGFVLALVKPQFEVGSVNLDKRGVVANPEAVREMEARLCGLCEKLGFTVKKYFPAKVKGRDGNQEYFIYATKN